MPVEMHAEEVRWMSREEPAKYNAEVEERHIRFSETAPVQSPFDEARLPGNERALYPYIARRSTPSSGPRSPRARTCVTVIMGSSCMSRAVTPRSTLTPPRRSSP